MITYRSRWLRYVELWFDEPCGPEPYDVLHRYRSSEPVPGAVNTEFHTISIDLTQDDQALIAQFHRNTRSQIRRAQDEDNLSYEALPNPSPQRVEEFVRHHGEFARAKGLPPVEQSQLLQRSAAGMLALSRIASGERTLVWHAHLRVGATVVLTHSASLFRGNGEDFQRLVGRANRVHHLLDMRFYRSQGCTVYDLGGWYTGKDDEAKLLINRFKEQFGGRKVLQYDVTLHKTLRAKLLKASRRLV